MLKGTASKAMRVGRVRLFAVLSAVMMALTLGYATKAYGAPGYLDPSFDTDGKLTTDFSGGVDEEARDVVVQEDGKVVVVGSDRGFALARYNPDGTLDPSFGAGGTDGDGKVRSSGASGQAAAVRSDGKILVAGGSNFGVARYNPDGTLDTSFGGGDGLATTSLGSSQGDNAYGLALQGDKVLVAGTSFNGDPANGGTDSDFALVRYDDSGNLDPTFGSGGKVETDFSGSGSLERGYSVAVQEDGKIVVAGEYRTVTFNSTYFSFAVARYNPDGTLDTSFDGDGKVITRLGDDSEANDLAIQEDGKIVAAGKANGDFGVARYRTNGSLDGEFGTNGAAVVDLGAGDVANGLALQDDGKMLLAGSSTRDLESAGINLDSDFALARLNDDGSPDASFHNDGKLKTDLGSTDDGASGVAVQDDGKVVAAGYVATGYNREDPVHDFAVARYFGGDDATTPAVKAPVQALPTDSTLGASTTSASVPVRISWSATDSEGEVTRYQLQQSVNGGAYANVTLPGALTTSITPYLTPTYDYRFRVRATDDNGNTGSFKYGPRFTVDAHQESSTAIAYSRIWRQQSLGGSYGGAVKYATARGATATLTFTGTNVAWVAPKNNARGRAEVYLDGAKVATVDLYSSKALSSRVIYSASGLNPSATHTLQVKVLGTKKASSSSTRVDVDAFLVLR